MVFQRVVVKGAEETRKFISFWYFSLTDLTYYINKIRFFLLLSPATRPFSRETNAMQRDEMGGGASSHAPIGFMLCCSKSPMTL